MPVCSTPGVICRLFFFERRLFANDAVLSPQSVAFKAGARRRNSRQNTESHHASTFANSLLAATAAFVVSNNCDKLPLKFDVPPQYNFQVEGHPRATNGVKAPPRECYYNAEEKVYGAINQEEFLKDVRKLQARTKCTHKTCVHFIELFTKYFGEDKVPHGFGSCDKKLKEAAGVNVIELHGCTACNRHVFLPSKRTHCPHCGGARYDAKGKPKEVLRLFILYIIFLVRLSCANLAICLLCAESFLFPVKAAFEKTFEDTDLPTMVATRIREAKK